MSLVGMNKKAWVADRNRFFGTQIKPSFDALSIVHQNYIENFTTLLEMLENQKVPNQEIIHWLRHQSNEYVAHRDMLTKVDEQIKNFQNFFSRNSLLDPEKYDVLKCLMYYCYEINEYFSSSLGNSGATWYESTLIILENHIKSSNQQLIKQGLLDQFTDEDLKLLCDNKHPNEILQAQYDFEAIFQLDHLASAANSRFTSSDIKNILKELRKRYQRCVYYYYKMQSLCDYQ